MRMRCWEMTDSGTSLYVCSTTCVSQLSFLDEHTTDRWRKARARDIMLLLLDHRRHQDTGHTRRGDAQEQRTRGHQRNDLATQGTVTRVMPHHRDLRRIPIPKQGRNTTKISLRRQTFAKRLEHLSRFGLPRRITSTAFLCSGGRCRSLGWSC